VHLVGFIIRIYHDAQSSECQIRSKTLRDLILASQSGRLPIELLYEKNKEAE